MTLAGFGGLAARTDYPAAFVLTAAVLFVVPAVVLAAVHGSNRK